MKVVAVYTDSCRILVDGLGQLQYSVHWEAIQQATDALPIGSPFPQVLLGAKKASVLT